MEEYLLYSNREYIRKYGFEQFIKLLSENSIKLNLNSNYITNYITCQEIELLFKSHRFQFIKELYLNNNGIDIIGIKLIAEILKTNKSLTVLSLEYNIICSESVKYIAESLKNNKYLIILNLCNNNIDNKGAEYIAELLIINKFLLDMDLSFNYIGVKGIELIIKSLELNKSLIHLNLSFNGSSDGIIGRNELLKNNKINRDKILKERAEEKIYFAIFLQIFIHRKIEFLEFFDELNY